MSSNFNARNADAYEKLMGRWSRRLAGPLIAFTGIADGERVLDVGCGTGSLTFALAKAANVAAIAAIDYSPVYVEYARSRNRDPRIAIDQGDATQLAFPDASFDRAIAMLVLHFVKQPELAVAQMRRVVRPGGVVGAAVWDGYGGLGFMRMFWDTAAVLDPAARPERDKAMVRPMAAPDEMKKLFQKLGLKDVVQDSVTIRMDYADFADYWAPFEAGEGPAGAYVLGLDPVRRDAVTQAVRAAYLSGQPDGPRSFPAVAWVCRGIVA
jgi:ubiquinone/menaquinone biosynthesis C-methylase UbiE